MRKISEEAPESLHAPAMRELARTLQCMGLSFAFSSKTALARYEGRLPPEDIHVVIFIEKDDKPVDQSIMIKEIAEAAHDQDRRTIVNCNSQLWYTADVNAPQLQRGSNSKRFTLSITQWEPQPFDIRYLDLLPYVSPMFLLLSMLESLASSTPRTRNKISKLLALVQCWHISNGEAIDPSSFSRFPKSLGNAKELSRVYPPLRGSFLRMGVNVSAINVGNQDVEDRRPGIVLQAAVNAVTALQHLGIHCALFGGMACYLYGNTRVPNDVDILALPQHGNITRMGNNVTAEELKQRIVQVDSTSFFLRDPRDASSPYKVLWYRNPSGPCSYSSVGECKIDIVLPGVLQLPNVRLEQLRTDGQYNLPVIPFSLLLLHKLKAWDDRVNAQESYKRARQGADSLDVLSLLHLPPVVSLKFSKPWDDETLFNKDFQVKTRERVGKFCMAFPRISQSWRELGFDIGQSESC